MSVEGLRGTYALSFMSFVHFEFILAPFIFNLATASFITHLSKLESDAALLYLPELSIIVVPLQLMFKLLLKDGLFTCLLLLVALLQRVFVAFH